MLLLYLQRLVLRLPLTSIRLKGGEMKSKYIILILVCSAFALTSFNCSFLSKKYEKKQTFQYSLSTANKTKLSVDNTNGEVRIFKSDKDSVLTVTCIVTDMVKKKDLDKPLEDVVIKIDSSSDQFAFSSETAKHKKSFFSLNWGSPNVDYEISLPKNLSVKVENTNGKLKAENVDNDLTLDVTNGSIEIHHVSGQLDLNTTNGSISGELDSTKGIKAETVNGKIKLAFDTTFLARIKAEVTNGKVNYEGLNFVSFSGGKKDFTGTLRNGDKEVKLSTVNGSITLSKK